MTTVEPDTGSTVYPIRAVDRVCGILDTLANNIEGVSLSKLAEATEMPKSSTFRYLTALEARHYVERSTDGTTYRLGLAFRPKDTRSLERLVEHARPVLEKLRDQLEETINLGVLDGAYVVHTLVAESPHMMRLAARVGERGFVHSTALGKAITATLPEDRVRAILEITGMPSFTDTTLTDPDAFIAELEKTRQVGFGVDEAENQMSGRCLAVPIKGISVPAGLSVSAPTIRLPMERVPSVVKELRRAARMLARQMRS